MRKLLYTYLVMAFCCNAYGNKEMPLVSDRDSLILLTTADLRDVVMNWTKEYTNSMPGKAIRIKTISEVPQVLETGEIAFANERSAISSPGEANFMIVVGRNVIVPVINSSNPYMDDILTKGISPGKMKMIVEGSQVKWRDILNIEQGQAIKFNYLDDPVVTDAIAAFTGSEPGKINGRVFSSTQEMFSEISRDIFSVGFCRLSDLQGNSGLNANISFMPLDKNSNGTMDSNEDIYVDLPSFERGVWIGKYPKELYQNIFSLTGTPVSENASLFLNWLITDGQKILSTEGYSGLILTERLSVAGKISGAMVSTETYSGNRGIFSTLMIGILIGAAVIFLIGVVMRSFRKKQLTGPVSIRSEGPFLDEKSIVLPKGLYFDKTHTWAYLEQDGKVKVGVDDFLLQMTGLVNRIKTKKPGDRVKKGDEILSVINSGKQLHLYSPLSGVITELNPGLESDAGLINSAPYTGGWVYRVEPENWQRENQLLFMAEKHRQFILTEIARIKDFLASLLKNRNIQYSPVILQDGGMLRQGILSEMGPEVWEEFQTRIIDPSRTVWFYEII